MAKLTGPVCYVYPKPDEIIMRPSIFKQILLSLYTKSVLRSILIHRQRTIPQLQSL